MSEGLREGIERVLLENGVSEPGQSLAPASRAASSVSAMGRVSRGPE